jgi:hypothetical protein
MPQQLEEENDEPPHAKVWLWQRWLRCPAALAAARWPCRPAPRCPRPRPCNRPGSAHDLGAYRFTTDLTATAYPAPMLATGRPARRRLHLR